MSSSANAMTSAQLIELVNKQRRQLDQMENRVRWMESFIEQQRALIDRLIEQGNGWAKLVSQMPQAHPSATLKEQLEMIAALLLPVDQQLHLHHRQKQKDTL
jgi:hypothetical protein